MIPKQPRYTREPSDMYDISEAVQDHDDEDDNIEVEVDGSNELTPLNLVRPGVDPSSLISSDYGGLISGKNNTQSLAANAILTSNNNRDSSDFSMLRRRTQNTGQNDTIKSNNSNASIETIIQEYTTACQIYGCSNRINAGILTTFRFQLPSLRVSGSFFDSDMLALVEVLLNHVNGALSYIKRLDFSLAAMDGKQFGKKGIRSHGAYALSKVLQISMHIEEVFLTRNKIGPYGASAIFCASKYNPTLRTLLMRGCRIRERGAMALATHILMPEEDDERGIHQKCGLREVDLSLNQIGFRGVFAIEKGLKQTTEKRIESQLIQVDLEGNMVFQEVMNSVTHGLGILLAAIGTILLTNRTRGKPTHYIFSCAVYSTSLIVLYLSSTLFHSFFALQKTQSIFQVFDKCAIYILIAGSYTPFLSIALHHEPMWSTQLLAFIWICAICGISVEAFYPLWIHKGKFSLAMYLGMGWACMACVKDLAEALSMQGIYLLVAGGVGYTGGVPFFVRNNHLDHSIWHCFVMAGSMFHWFCIYYFIVTLDENV